MLLSGKCEGREETKRFLCTGQLFLKSLRIHSAGSAQGEAEVSSQGM